MNVRIQNSYEKSQAGKLYIVPTPIGNLEDITFRALQTLKEVDLIAAEDTRHTQKLLNYFQIDKRLLSFHEHSKQSRKEQLINKLLEGENIALVSDAGMPAISDPGYELIKSAIEEDISVIVLPGANAALCALIGSGLSPKEFLFYGFLPRKKQEKESELERLKNIKATLIFYESPYRLVDTLQNITKSLGNRQVAIAREITKIHETYVRGNVEEVVKWLKINPVKGECCIVVEGNEVIDQDEQWWKKLSIEEHVKHYEEMENIPHKLALKRVATDRNIPKREVYQAIHIKE